LSCVKLLLAYSMVGEHVSGVRKNLRREYAHFVANVESNISNSEGNWGQNVEQVEARRVSGTFPLLNFQARIKQWFFFFHAL
jgi:hypothetical protein